MNDFEIGIFHELEERPHHCVIGPAETNNATRKSSQDSPVTISAKNVAIEKTIIKTSIQVNRYSGKDGLCFPHGEATQEG